MQTLVRDGALVLEDARLVGWARPELGLAK
jgi:hypothetical protein